VVSFTPRPLYPQGKRPWYPLDRKLGGPQSRSGRGGEEKNSQPPPGIEPYHYLSFFNQERVYRLIPHFLGPHERSDFLFRINLITHRFGVTNGTYRTHGEEEKLYKILVGKRECKRPPGSPTRRRKDNIKMYLKKKYGVKM
jgi:hypothetical protein